MTHEEIRKLLGGYATNTLTEAERKALFEAALEDQELFDALQQDQSLHELLSQPVARAQVRQALDAPPSQKAAAWARWWTWGGAVGAVAAGVLVIAVIRSNGPRVDKQLASLDTPRSAEVARARDVDERRAKAPAPAKPSVNRPPDSGVKRLAQRAEARLNQAVSDQAAVEAKKDVKEDKDQVPAPLQQVQQVQQSPPPPFANQQQAQVTTVPQAMPFRNQEVRAPAGAGAAGFVAGPNAPQPLRYSLVRRDANGADTPVPADAVKAGDAVRITVASTMQGFIFLYRLDPSGNWTSVNPSSGRTWTVVANSSITIPDAPLQVGDKDVRLRVLLLPDGTDVLSKRAEKAKTAALPAAPTPPIQLDITIAPNAERR